AWFWRAGGDGIVTPPGKSHPPDCKVPFFKTPHELCGNLARLGHDVTERQLTDWRRKKLLPDLTRHGLANGWTDPDIVLRAHTLCVMRRHSSHTDGRLLLTWFAGFDYSEPDIHEVWLRQTEAGWRTTLESLVGGPLEDDDTELVMEDALKVPKGRIRASRSVM